MHYLCKDKKGNLFVVYGKDLTKYVGKSTMISVGSPEFRVLQIIDILTMKETISRT